MVCYLNKQKKNSHKLAQNSHKTRTCFNASENSLALASLRLAWLDTAAERLDVCEPLIEPRLRRNGDVTTALGRPELVLGTKRLAFDVSSHIFSWISYKP